MRKKRGMSTGIAKTILKGKERGKEESRYVLWHGEDYSKGKGTRRGRSRVCRSGVCPLAWRSLFKRESNEEMEKLRMSSGMAKTILNGKERGEGEAGYVLWHGEDYSKGKGTRRGRSNLKDGRLCAEGGGGPLVQILDHQSIRFIP